MNLGFNQTFHRVIYAKMCRLESGVPPQYFDTCLALKFVLLSFQMLFRVGMVQAQLSSKVIPVWVLFFHPALALFFPLIQLKHHVHHVCSVAIFSGLK